MYKTVCALTLVLVALSVGLNSGCARRQPGGLVILIDESSSFGYWNDATAAAAFAARTLGPRDRLIVIGIDDHGFDRDDVRLSATLPEAALAATGEAKSLAREIRALSRRRESGRGTDILGALEQAEYYCVRLADPGQYRWRVLVMSDLVKDEGPRVAGCSARLQFPAGTTCTAAFVTEQGAAAFKSNCAWWADWFQQAGLQIGPGEFLPPSLSQDHRSLAAILCRPAQVQQASRP